jgi:hypothetical protein
MKTVITQVLLLAAVMLIGAGCNPQIDSSVATFNAQATNVASSGGHLAATLSVTPVPTSTPVVASYDLTTDSTQLLIHAWGQAYGLPSGSQFTIIATQEQVGQYIVQTMQLAGFQDSVKGGSATLGSGQLRLDLSIIDTAGATGTGTITFQPTLDAAAALRLNLIGSSFGTLKLPNGLLGDIGDSTEKALIGAANDSQSKVKLSGLTLENGQMKVTGTVK